MIIQPENAIVYYFNNFFFRFYAIFLYPFHYNGIYSVQVKGHYIFSFAFRIFENIQDRVKNIVEKFFVSFFKTEKLSVFKNREKNLPIFFEI